MCNLCALEDVITSVALCWVMVCGHAFCANHMDGMAKMPMALRMKCPFCRKKMVAFTVVSVHLFLLELYRKTDHSEHELNIWFHKN
jgi:hypothetical protein